MSVPDPALGVVLVSYNSGDVILDCLETLLAERGVRLAIVVVDNGSPDDTLERLRGWADGSEPWSPLSNLPFVLSPAPKPVPLCKPGTPVLATEGHTVSLLETGRNGGFAAGVNAGLRHLATEAAVDRFWILNPDSLVEPGTARVFATAQPEGNFSLLGGRLLYLEDVAHTEGGRIQMDGGVIDYRTGVTHNINQFASHSQTPTPKSESMDFITGASMVASRRFYEEAGPMPEDYFLYYEEVDWALRRGDLPLVICEDAVVWHRAGTSIGSAAPGRSASPFSHYFKHRNRIRFVRRHFPWSLPMAFAYSLAKSVQLFGQGDRAGARAVLGGSFGLPPATGIRGRLSPEAQALAFR